MLLVIKWTQRINHLEHLKAVFHKLYQNQLKMNPLNRTFRVISGKFLLFVVRNKGIKVDPAKIKAIIEHPDSLISNHSGG